ncbi:MULTISPECIES: maleate cis-trans isomerase family protein [unclassified Novosphingobium]|uniref:maleate cis-trans isomerase family protein n=1 Tax=Novosphingobium TaxID=165696 RepID=UPI001445705B|nr:MULTISPECIES: arylmalonate decarboxylase [unclassified Novosphingobium]NKJ44801.1 maleate isomerase [Novosphingobium sp. SG720]NMN05947.1 maleate isomerase [Novosphingobium sp. SG919]NMN88243.1 maleate isomerase [Novosphingobium sp. SG916]
MSLEDPARGKGYGWRLRLGMLLPSSNPVAEPELIRFLPEGVSLHTTRLKLAGSTRDDLLGMTDGVEQAVALLVDAGVDRIVFNCTAVSTFDPAMGETLRQRMEVTSGKPATSTSDAITAALAELAPRRIALVTPYIDPVVKREIAFLEHYGYEVVVDFGLGLGEGKAMSAIEPGEWYRHAMATAGSGADLVFLSCTAIRAFDVIADLERDLGLPVISSNQAMLWWCLRQAGLRDRIPALGRLLA